MPQKHKGRAGAGSSCDLYCVWVLFPALWPWAKSLNPCATLQWCLWWLSGYGTPFPRVWSWVIKQVGNVLWDPLIWPFRLYRQTTCLCPYLCANWLQLSPKHVISSLFAWLLVNLSGHLFWPLYSSVLSTGIFTVISIWVLLTFQVWFCMMK